MQIHIDGQPRLFGPFAGVFLSGQHPKDEFWQPFKTIAVSNCIIQIYNVYYYELIVFILMNQKYVLKYYHDLIYYSI